MKKLKFGLNGLKDILSRDEMKKVMGGFGSDDGGSGGCVKACGALNDACVTTDCEPGNCEYYMGIFGCVAD